MNDSIVSDLQQLLSTCQSIHEITSTSDYGSSLEHEAQETTTELEALVREVHQADELTITLIDPVFQRINGLCNAVIREKAKNPLISSELVDLAEKARSEVKEIENLLVSPKHHRKQRQKPWHYPFIQFFKKLFRRA